MRNNYLLSILFVASMLVSCKSVDYTIIEKKTILDKRVKPMHVNVDSKSIANFFSVDNYFADDERSDIENTIKNNFTFMSDSNDTFLNIQVKNLDADANYKWYIPAACTAGIINIVGVPVVSQTWKVELTAQVTAASGKVIKTYSSAGEKTEYSALFWGYSPKKAGSLTSWSELRAATYLNAVVKACDNLRNQIEIDDNGILLKK